EPEDTGQAIFYRTADLRFVGQLSELRIPLGERGQPVPDMAAIEARFRQAYQNEFGFDLADSEVEMVNLHLSATLPLRVDTGLLFTRGANSNEAKPYQHRSYLDREGQSQEVPVYQTHECVGATLQGPSLLDHSGSTIWVPPGISAMVDADGSVVLNIERE